MRRLALIAAATGLPYAIAVFNLLVFAAALIIAGAFYGLDALFLGMTIVFGATGAVIARRQPRNPLGWMFLMMSLGASLAVLSGTVAASWDAPLVAAYGSASWIPPMVPGLTFMLLLFPDGRPLSPRWRRAVWIAGVGVLSMFFGTLTKPGPLEDHPEIDNPLGWSGSGPFEAIGTLLVFVSIVCGVVSLVKRFRRAQALERQQIKWLALAGSFAGAGFILGFAAFYLAPESGTPGGGVESIIYGEMMAGVLSLPVAAAVAMLRYRLYDIDLVIRRTVTYAALTATLVGAYLLTVLVAQLVLPPRSDFGVALSTLAAVVAFAPARRRIQEAVDRRFFRRSYDAQQTLAAFGLRTRDEVDLNSLTGELRELVGTTMQPTHVSVWVRP